MDSGSPPFIKAIETVYNGYRFRSRLEARWAVFLDVLEIPYEYEKQGYEIDGRRYLPDFWIPYADGGHDCVERGWGFWLEIKPVVLTDDEIDLLDGLARLTGHRTYAICGLPRADRHLVYVFDHYHRGEPKQVPLVAGILVETFVRRRIYNLRGHFKTREADKGVDINEHSIDIWQPKDFPGGSDRFSFPGPAHQYWGKKPGQLRKAFRAATQARFEHGEKPKVR